MDHGRRKPAGKGLMRLGEDVGGNQFVEHVPGDGLKVGEQPFTFAGGEAVPPAQDMFLPARAEAREAVLIAFVRTGL